MTIVNLRPYSLPDRPLHPRESIIQYLDKHDIVKGKIILVKSLVFAMERECPYSIPSHTSLSEERESV